MDEMRRFLGEDASDDDADDEHDDKGETYGRATCWLDPDEEVGVGDLRLRLSSNCLLSASTTSHRPSPQAACTPPGMVFCAWLSE